MNCFSPSITVGVNCRRVALLVSSALLAHGCNATSQTVRNPAPQDSVQTARADDMADPLPSAKLLYSSARLLADQKNDAQALIVLDQLIGQYPHFLPGYRELAELHLRHGRTDQAIIALSRGLRVAPNDAVLLNNLGMCWMLKGDYDEAQNQFALAVAAAPNHARYQTNHAMTLGLLGRYDEAFEAYKRILPPGEAHFNVGVLCDARGDDAQAVEHFHLAREYGFTERPR